MQDLKNKPDAASPELHGILWLASYPKSGNTWIRNFLHNLSSHHAQMQRFGYLTEEMRHLAAND